MNVNPQQIITKSLTSCGHYDSNQELCHACHQRAKRNIPVYLHEEKWTREVEEDRLLEQYEHNRNLDEQKERDVCIKKSNVLFS